MDPLGSNPFNLIDRTVLITGASGGIGGATARVCGSLGAKLVLADLTEPLALAQELTDAGVQCQTAGFDVRDRAATEQLVQDIGALDAAVINAGFCPWDDWNDEHWDDMFDTVMDINVKSVIHLARAALPGMMAQGHGKLVLVSSLAARSGGLRASPHYVAAKGGVSAMVKWLARKAATAGVTVNAVCPGATETAMTQGQPFDVDSIPLKRMATTKEIAMPIAFLLSDGANYMTGATLDINGGVYMA
jgi:NAD(P)-dependent dehydrogenase (short-subunit alcohol dehydrogenase family)